MTIKLRLISGEDDDFIRDIEVGAEATFYDLHNYIQNLLDFEEGQIASFFITDENWNKEEEITLMDMEMEESSDSFLMEDTKLNQFITKPKQRLLYAFDFFNERNLFIECYDINDNECKKIKCVYSAGNPPDQLDLSDILDEDSYDDEESVHKQLGFDDEDDDDFYKYPDINFDDEDDDDPMLSYSDDMDDY